MINEIWKPIKGYEGLYEVSDFGRIKSLGRTVNRGLKKMRVMERILKSGNNQHGYKIVALWKNGEGKTRRVHRLIAVAFIPNPKNKPHINHLNGIVVDNRIENLEWCTHFENMQHAWRNGFITTEKLGREKRVAQILDGVVIKIWKSQSEANRKLGTPFGCISDCCRGVKYRHTAGGFEWRFA